MQPSTFWVPKKNYNSWLPEGFVFVTGPDEEVYIVLEFMVPELDQNYNAKQKKLELRASSAAGSVSAHLFITALSGSFVMCAGFLNIRHYQGTTF